MKKILYSLIAVAISFSAMAQDATQPQTGATKHQRKDFKAHGDAAQKLNLSADQKQQMKSINQDFKQQMQTLKGSGSGKDLKVKREALMKDHQQKIDNLLTPEQKTKYEEFRKNNPKAHGGLHQPGTADNNKLEKLNLTQNQQAKAKELHESLKSNVQSIEKNTALTNDQKKEQVKELKKKHKEELQSMLTTEQKANLKSRMKNRPDRKTVK